MARKLTKPQRNTFRRLTDAVFKRAEGALGKRLDDAFIASLTEDSDGAVVQSASYAVGDAEYTVTVRARRGID